MSDLEKFQAEHAAAYAKWKTANALNKAKGEMHE